MSTKAIYYDEKNPDVRIINRAGLWQKQHKSNVKGTKILDPWEDTGLATKELPAYANQ